MPTFPAFDLTRVDLSKLTAPGFGLPSPDLSSLPVPDVSLPDVTFPKVDLPGTERVAGVARDAGYIGVGLVVLGVQQAQVRRRDLTASLRTGLEQLRDTVV